ncbi:hypothetical protein [Microbacterium sp.]|uniref:hypothetical protein n=1 Tax=Microbacterium sp. TaxID=51671 RepID=UPI002CD4B55C|nr:hypothetical protein [Microbacterium sp.]HWK76498.1 hypothetical protein [Microbacterium sp.]
MSTVEVLPIADADAAAVARFLHDELNPAVTVVSWSRLLRPPWADASPNRGWMLKDGDRIVGAYAAVYSRRPVGGVEVTVCNLAAYCVLEDYRMHSVRLIRALLKARDYMFTDLSPSGNVVAMNERLGFTRLDTATKLVINPPWVHGRDVRVSGDAVAIARVLRGPDAQVHRDHRDAAAARHVLVQSGDEYAYLVFRAHTLKRLRLFALPLYVGGSRDLLRREWRAVRSHLLMRHGLPFTLAEKRILGFTAGFGRVLAAPRARMVRGTGIPAADVDYLYSELALVNW